MSTALHANPAIADTGILLDAGTNEAEVLVFSVGESRYGVNVAKVREVLTIEEITRISQSHPAIEGVVRIRDHVATLVNLSKYLEGKEDSGSTDDTMLLLDFNNQMIAFMVQSVDRIFRVSWEDARPVPSMIGSSAPITSVIELGGTLVQILDFETIATVITGDAGYTDPIHHVEGVAQDYGLRPVVFVDDSHTISRIVIDALAKQGFTNLKNFSDGQQAWDYLASIAKETDPEHVREKVAAIVTDIEMPGMDGLHLTKNIRTNPVLQDLPVILFSSIVSSDNEKKGRQVGATAQLTKPSAGKLAGCLVDLFSEYDQKNAAGN
jgi:two-component system, chemotaxis family, chemotaxis protein CheV